MTAVDPSRFSEFFEALNGRPPYAWQARLCAHVLTTGRWPDAIDAPTGSGKSSVIDVHVFAVAASVGSDVRPPRRLAVTVDRRALVDDHAERATQIADRLAKAVNGPDGILHDVAEALRSLRAWPTVDGPRDQAVLPVITLRGGLPHERDWVDDPAACQVIAATPQMWGSRLLFGGYGSSRGARPREAGLLAMDSVVVLDEAHLNRQLLTTARRVRMLTEHTAAPHCLPPLQVVAMTATPDEGEASVGVRREDLGSADEDRSLAARLQRPKPVRLVPSGHLPGTASTRGHLANDIADEVLTLTSEVEGTVGCVVNTVALALAVADRLSRARLPAAAPRAGARERTLRVVPVVGRMRPYDVAQLRARHAGLFSHAGDGDIDVVVATQTIEVGVDMDFAGLVTELAPGTAIAQRVGRVNRSGSRPSAPVVVVVPKSPAALTSPKASAPPYQSADLAAGLDWLTECAADPNGLAAWSLHPEGENHRPPSQACRRPVLHRPEWWNVRDWSRTSRTPFAEADLALWLNDDLAADESVSLVVRAGLPRDSASARIQLGAIRPQPHELFPALRGAVGALMAPETIGTFSDGAPRTLVIRSGDILDDDDARTLLEAPEARLRPGDVVVIGADTRVFRTFPVGTGDEPLHVGIVDAEHGRGLVPDVAERGVQGDALAIRVGLGTPAVAGVDPTSRSALLVRLADLSRADGDRTDDLLTVLHEWLSGIPNDQNEIRASLRLLFRERKVAAVTFSPPVEEGSEDDAWVVVAGSIRAEEDAELRQTWSRGTVLLDEHQEAVAASARSLAGRLGLTESTAEVLDRAGLLHDEGKRDSRFQRSLRPHAGAHGDKVLAKSGMRDRSLRRRARSAADLDGSWRHEQRSAAAVWAELAQSPAELRDLVTRLVGTSHGYGRGGFDDTSRALLHGAPGRSDIPDGSPLSTAVAELFDDGCWEEIVERTDARWGPWGVAYLEALLRAADCTVSGRGS